MWRWVLRGFMQSMCSCESTVWGWDPLRGSGTEPESASTRGSFCSIWQRSLRAATWHVCTQRTKVLLSPCSCVSHVLRIWGNVWKLGMWEGWAREGMREMNASQWKHEDISILIIATLCPAQFITSWLGFVQLTQRLDCGGGGRIQMHRSRVKTATNHQTTSTRNTNGTN